MKLIYALGFVNLLMSVSADNSTDDSAEAGLEKVEAAITNVLGDALTPLEQAVVFAVFSFCSQIKTLLGVSSTQMNEDDTDLSNLTLVFRNSSYSKAYNLSTAATDITSDPDFDSSKEFIVFIPGFTSSPYDDSFGNISTAFLSIGEYNIYGLDASSLIGSRYFRSSTYVEYIGERFGEILVAFTENGVNASQMYVIGHSLGAQIAGFCGKRYYNLTGEKLARITGLDPAGPCFFTEDANHRINATDAVKVDVIHSDGGVLGLITPVGQVDYYPNSGSDQPGCLEIGCSHSRSWYYFNESIYNPEAFESVECASWQDFKAGKCASGSLSYMGYGSEEGTTGIYFLQTNAESPYGREEQGVTYTSTI